MLLPSAKVMAAKIVPDADSDRPKMNLEAGK
jgi:hypothetical protein